MTFNRIQSRVVTGLLTAHNILRRYLYQLGLLDSHLWRKCGVGEETSAHILCDCEDLASLWHAYLGCFLLEPVDIRSLGLGSIWSYRNITGLPWYNMGHKGPVLFKTYVHRGWEARKANANLSIYLCIHSSNHPWSRVLLENLTGLQLVKKFYAFYWIRRFITAFTSARHLSLPSACSIQSIPSNPTSWRSILILSTHLHLGLPSGLLPSGFPTKTLHNPSHPHTRHMARPSHSYRFYHPKNIGWALEIIKLLVM